MKGIFIPMEFQEIEELTNTECMVLAIYKYYTETGDLHCCSLRNEDICKMVRLKDGSNLRRIKKHLKDLGYIRTDGGIRVIYLGIQGGHRSPSKEDIEVPQGGHRSPPGRTYKSKREDIEVLHKKEEKEEKRIKKEEMTNFDLLLTRLPSDYKTPDRLEYLKEEYMNKINNMDLSGGILDMALVNIKDRLNKLFPMNYVIPKPVPVSDTIDMF